MAKISDYETVEIAMISKNFPGKYIDKDKDIKLIKKSVFKNLDSKERKKKENAQWVLLEVVKTNKKNILFWVQKEELKFFIKEIKNG